MILCSPLAKKVIPVLMGSWLLSLSCPATATQEGLGRLFFTPERRQQLDRQREMNIPDRQPSTVDPTLTVDGMVTRSSGRRTAWINGTPQTEREMGSSLSVTPRHGDPARVLVQAGDSPAARARVGETVNRNSGESSDLLNGGTVRVHGGPPATR